MLAKTEGNPLFVEETIRMLVESDGETASPRIPDTLQALIAARIDHLPAEEKALLHRSAVIGRVFWRGAVEHLAPELDVDALLDNLLLRDFILAEPRSTIVGEQAFRFKHVLIREVGYGGLTKAERAKLHERFAEWLHERAGEELLEIRAYHLDHAAQLQAELDGSAPAKLASEAAAALEEAGRRALARESNRAARKLLLRACELEPTLERRYHAARAAWRMSELPTVSVEMTSVLEGARAAGDSTVEGKALTALAEVAMLREGDLTKATELVDAALDALPAEGRFGALEVRGRIAWWTGDFETQERMVAEELEIARRLERKDLEAHALEQLAGVHRHLGRLEEAEQTLRRGLELAEESGSIVARAQALFSLGSLRLERRETGIGKEQLEEAEVPVRRGGRCLDARAHVQLTCLGRRAVGRRRRCRTAGARGDPAAQAARGSGRPLRKPASARRDSRPARSPRRGRAARAGGDRDRRRARHLLAGDHGDVARARPGGAGQGCRGGGAAPARALARRVDGFRGLEVWILTRLEEFLRSRDRNEEADAYAERRAGLAPAPALGDAFARRIERIA